MFYLRLRWFFMIDWSIRLSSLGLPNRQNGSMRAKHLEEGEWNKRRFIDFFYGMRRKAKRWFGLKGEIPLFSVEEGKRRRH